MSRCIAFQSQPNIREPLITLTADELRAAAATFDALRGEGVGTVGAMARAVRAVNVMRTPGPAPDCVDCQRRDGTCPGHLPRKVVTQ